MKLREWNKVVMAHNGLLKINDVETIVCVEAYKERMNSNDGARYSACSSSSLSLPSTSSNTRIYAISCVSR